MKEKEEKKKKSEKHNKKEYKITRGCVYSRAYHNTMKMVGDKLIARQAGRAAVVNVFGPKA